MQLRTARLCLDCDEVHDAQQCPICASETFAFLTRWVPVPERAQKRSSRSDPPTAETLHTYRELLHPEEADGGPWRTLRRGALGLAIFGLAGWAWRRNARTDADVEPPEPEKTPQDGRQP